MHFLADYGMFLLKVFTIVIGILVILFGIVAIATKGKIKPKEKLEIKKLNDKYKEFKQTLSHTILNKQQLKHWQKQEKKQEKIAEKDAAQSRKKMYVIQFYGDVKASAVKHLREEITSILLVATPQDEVVVNIESPGGMVHTYGLAASQLARLRQNNIPLTVTIDKVGASGGYLMACVANKILAAPFAIVGSIGVIAQLPNFNRWLRKNDIDYEQMMAGEYKRTVTIFGKNTDKGRKKFQEDIEQVHTFFKNFIREYRPIVDIQKVATGEHWLGQQALELKLIDAIMTSDDYLLNASKTTDIYEVRYKTRKSLGEKFALSSKSVIEKFAQSWRSAYHESKLF